MDPSRRTGKIYIPLENKSKNENNKKSLPLKPSSEENRNTSNLEKIRISQKETDSAQKKTTSVIESFVKKPEKLSLGQKIINKVTEGAVNLTKKKGYKDDFVKIDKESKRQLIELTGNHKLSLALEAITPRITKSIIGAVQEKLKESNKFYADGVMQTLNNQDQFITECLNATLLKMMATVALKTKIQVGEDNKVTFPDMASFLLGITEKHLQHLHSQIAKIEKIPDEKIRKQKLKELIEPFKNDILHELMPHHADDIVLPDGFIMNKLKKYIYEAIEEALPDLIIKNYHAVMDPSLEHRLEDENKLKQFPGGELLNAIADFTAHKLPQKIPGIVESNSKTIVEELGPKLFIEEQDSEKLKQLGTWFGNGLRQLVSSDDEQIQKLWKFSEFYLSPIIKHTLLKMAENSKDEDPDDCINAISRRFFSMITTFFEEQHDEIYSVSLELRAAKTPEEKARKEAELMRLFEPLSDEITEFTGLDDLEELPIPTFLRSVIDVSFEEQISKRLVKLYLDMNPLEKEQTAEQKKFSAFAEVIISNAMPALMEQVQTKAPLAFSEALAVYMDKKPSEEMISNYLKNCMNDPSANKMGGYMKDQVQKVLSNVLIKIGSMNLPIGINFENEPMELFPNLLVQTLSLNKRYVEQMDRETLLKLAQIKKLPQKEQELEKEKLLKQFIPLGVDLLKMAGFSSAQTMPGPSELKPMLFDLLKETVMPVFLLDTFQGFTQSTMSQGEILAHFLPEELEPIEKASRGIAEIWMPKIQMALTDNSVQVVSTINDALPVTKLSAEQQEWLGQELKKVGSMKSPVIKEGWGFLQNYLQGMVFKTLGNLAMQYDKDHPSEEEINTLKQASLQLIVLAVNGWEGFDKTVLAEVKNLQNLPDQERELELKKLAPRLQSSAVHLLYQMGIKSADDLAVPNFVKNLLWEKLTSKILPELFIGYIYEGVALMPETPADTKGLANLDHLNSTIVTVTANLVPLVQDNLLQNKEKYTDAIHVAIEQVLPRVFEKASIQELIEEVIDPQENQTKHFLTLMVSGFKGFITPIILNLATANDLEGDVLEKSVSYLSTLISTHFQDKRDAFDAQLIGYDQLTDAGKANLLDEVFGEFLDDLLIDAGFDHLIIPERVYQQLLQQTYSLYQLFKTPLDIQNNSRLMLHRLMGIDVEQLKTDLNRYNEELKKAQPVDDLLGFAAEQINTQIQNYIAKEGDNLVKRLNDQLPVKKLSQSDQEWLANVMKNFSASNDPAIQNLWNYTSDVLHASLMKIFVDVAQGMPAAIDPKTAKDQLIPQMLKQVADLMGTNLEGMEEKIKLVNRQYKDENERKLEIRKLFIPLADDFFKFAGTNPLAAIPMPEGLKEVLSNELRQKILPDLLGEVFVDVKKWEMHTEADQNKLLRLFKNENPAIAAKVIARFATDILPVAIANPEKQVSEKVLRVFSDYILRQPGKRAEAIYQYMNQNQEEMTTLIRDNFAQMLDPSLELMDNALPEIENFIEAALLKVMANVFSKINERQSPEFLVNMGLKMLKMANDHFSEIHRIMKKSRKSLAYEVKPEKMLNQFNGLHPAMARDPKMTEKEQQELLYKNFLIPLTEEALKLAGIYDASDLPIPQSSQAVREKLFEELKKSLGPLVIETIMNSIDVDKMLLSTLEIVNEGIEHPENTVELPKEFERDDKQEEINKACGDLFLNMVKLIPDTAVGNFLASEKIRNLPAASFGKILRQHLMKTNLLQVINKGILSGMPLLNQAIYVNAEGELEVPEDLKFEFPETAEARQEERVRLEKEKTMIRKKFVNELTKTLRAQIIFRLKDFFSSHWKKLQEKFDNWVAEKFGPDALEVKAVIDKIFRMIFINIIGSAFQVIAYPFVKLMGVIISIHLRRKSEQISNTIHLDIHKNLMFKLVEETVKAFNEAPANPEKPKITKKKRVPK